ncbi:hypothetical protein N7463_008413 [Penicillium fimorum]|uniref:Uncharacterized protein n=1 Tax=Penicillium fimorum TaxID=1882269 RepID=A0A9W9XNU4_9EURO|nr:hypothetical protein N7463_008413 [Penicillium fimorum]
MKVPVVVGYPGETYVLIEQKVGSTLRAANPFTLASTTGAEDRCKLTFSMIRNTLGLNRRVTPASISQAKSLAKQKTALNQPKDM